MMVRKRNRVRTESDAAVLRKMSLLRATAIAEMNKFGYVVGAFARSKFAKTTEPGVRIVRIQGLNIFLDADKKSYSYKDLSVISTEEQEKLIQQKSKQRAA